VQSKQNEIDPPPKLIPTPRQNIRKNELKHSQEKRSHFSRTNASICPHGELEWISDSSSIDALVIKKQETPPGTKPKPNETNKDSDRNDKWKTLLP